MDRSTERDMRRIETPANVSDEELRSIYYEIHQHCRTFDWQETQEFCEDL
jgi:hypothetical protein